MYSLINTLFKLLTKDQRKSYYSLQTLVVIMAFTEIVGIASIIPFMTLVGDISLLEGNGFYANIYAKSGIEDPKLFLIVTGFAVLISLTFSAVVSTLTNWRLSLFAVSIGTQIGDRLYKHYMHQSWLFHVSNSSSQLTKQISTEGMRITEKILYPLMMLNARIILAVFIISAIFYYNPWAAISGIGVFGGAYIILYKVVRGRLAFNSNEISKLSAKRFQLMSEGFGGIKDITLLGRQKDMVQRFEYTGEKLARAQGTNNALGQVPRYIMELLAFGSILSLVLYLISNEQGDLSDILPVLSAYALAGFKLLPAMQQIYWALATIKGGQSAFYAVKDDLDASGKVSQVAVEKIMPMKSSANIELKDVFFIYPGASKFAVKNLNINIKKNTTIGIVGPSGSGKSTTIDILLGLIMPSSGQLLVDERLITVDNCRAWQNCIGYVPQSIFISEGSVLENVAFGVRVEDIDRIKVKEALRLSHLDDLVANLTQGVDTPIGERGIQLSGGQRQRIGIARALYHEPSVLIFDEATSALDGLSEKAIMESIQELSGNKTIIMIAHRLKTIKNCDMIYYIKEGQVEINGNYQYLLENSKEFRDMTYHG